MHSLSLIHILYQAKAAGRNQVTVYEQALHTRMVQRLEVEAELRDAVDNDEFEPHFQPIVHMGTGAIIGVEALVRWNHPRRGLLLPADFLVACQELGLMQSLGEQLLEASCHQARDWQPLVDRGALRQGCGHLGSCLLYTSRCV